MKVKKRILPFKSSRQRERKLRESRSRHRPDNKETLYTAHGHSANHQRVLGNPRVDNWLSVY